MELTRDQIREIVADDEAAFHDVVFEATLVSKNTEELRKIFASLPLSVQLIALEWGTADTVFGDEAYKFIKSSGIK